MEQNVYLCRKKNMKRKINGHNHQYGWKNVTKNEILWYQKNKIINTLKQAVVNWRFGFQYAFRNDLKEQESYLDALTDNLYLLLNERIGQSHSIDFDRKVIKRYGYDSVGLQFFATSYNRYEWVGRPTAYEKLPTTTQDYWLALNGFNELLNHCLIPNLIGIPIEELKSMVNNVIQETLSKQLNIAYQQAYQKQQEGHVIKSSVSKEAMLFWLDDDFERDYLGSWMMYYTYNNINKYKADKERWKNHLIAQMKRLISLSIWPRNSICERQSILKKIWNRNEWRGEKVIEGLKWGYAMNCLYDDRNDHIPPEVLQEATKKFIHDTPALLDIFVHQKEDEISDYVNTIVS